MNLHKLASRAIGRVNPLIEARVRRASGWTASPGARQKPQYQPDQRVSIQFQPLSSDDLQHVDGLNLQGIVKSIYVDGNFYGAVRREQIGGDLFLVNGETWLVEQAIELWPDWCRLLVRRQDDARDLNAG
ncbi:hypothetical protein SODG_005950 [Sodalis praecaptivus]